MIKHLRKILSLLALFIVWSASAETFTVDGIYYSTIDNDHNVCVTYPSDGSHYKGSITLEGEVEYRGSTYTVRSIGKAAFKEYSTADGTIADPGASERLVSIKLSNTITSVEDEAFMYCEYLQSIEIPNLVEFIGESAFEECIRLADVTLSRSLEEIRNRAFMNCIKLSKVQFNDIDRVRLTKIGNYSFFNCTSLTAITFPPKVQSIGQNAFESCTALGSIDLVNSITSVGDGAFMDCSAMTSATLSTALTTINPSTFQGCSKLAAITFPNGLNKILDNAFNGCKTLSTLSFPASVEEIGTSSFANCDGMRFLTFESSANPLKYGDTNFKQSLLERITLGRTLNCVSTAGAFRAQPNLKEVTVTETVSTLPASIFRECSALANVTIANGLYEVGQHAFRDCTALTALNLPASVYSIRNDAFNGCYNLATFALPNAVTKIESQSFSQCKKIARLDFSNITEIGGSAFNECEALNDINFSQSLVSIGDAAFTECRSLTSITIPGSVTTIGSTAFYYCPKLTAATFEAGSSMLRMGEDIFKESPIRDFELGRNIEYTGKSAKSVFDQNNTMRTVTITPAVTRIADCMFAMCEALESVEIPANVTTIGQRAFDSCPALRSIKSLNESAPAAYDNTWSSATYANATLTVPEESKTSYQSATGWKNFSSIAVVPSVPKYTVTASYNENGTVTLNGVNAKTTTVRQGDPLVIVATPDDGYIISSAEYVMGSTRKSFTETSVTIPSVTADVTVNVVFATRPAITPTAISIIPSAITLKPGEGDQLAVMFTPSNAYSPVTWTVTSGAAHVSVNDAGFVSAISNGSATVTATTANGLSATCEVMVNDGTAHIEEFPSLQVGQKYQARLMANGSIMTSGVTWTSSNPAAVYISESGVVQAVGEDWEAVLITANASGIYCTYDYWYAPNGNYGFTEGAWTYAYMGEGAGDDRMLAIYNGNQSQITVPASASDGAFSYTVGGVYLTSNGITDLTIPASVGLVEIMSYDITTLTCYATVPPEVSRVLDLASDAVIYVPAEAVDAYRNAAYYKDYTIVAIGSTPEVRPTAISIVPDEVTMKPGQTRQLKVVYEPADAYEDVTWEVLYNSDEATVSSTGLVTGVKVGYATVCATTTSGLTAYCAVTVETDEIPTPPTQEGQATFNFTQPASLDPVAEISNNTVHSLDGVTFSNNGIQAVANGGGTTARLWQCNTSGHAIEYRLYNGATLTIKAADSATLITKIEFTGAQLTAIELNANGNTSDYTWTNSAGQNSVSFAIKTNGNNKRADINTIIVTYESTAAGIDGITADGNEAEVEYYNLNGIRIQGEPAPGIYIRRQGSEVTKVVIR